MRIETTAKALKVSAVLDPVPLASVAIPAGVPRVTLAIVLPGRRVTAELAATSLRRALASIHELGPDRCACVLQGRLDGNAIAEAGIRVMSKGTKSAPAG